MSKPLDPKTVLLQQAGHISQEWQVKLPAGTSYGSIFKPETWTDVEKLMRNRGPKRPRKDDLLRIISSGFDVLCLVVAVDAGYRLEYYAGKRPSPVAQVLDDLAALPNSSTSAELKQQTNTLRKRWAAAGITREHLNNARRAYAKRMHPDANAVDGRQLAAANATLDAAMASLPEAA
jgi:hypothetical protein